jgi:Gpi18-like mannosyltransferase
MKRILVLVFLLAFILRLSLVLTAYHGDLNNNISWGTLAVERGLNGFYGSANADDWPYSAPNQPPLTILMFAGLRYIWIGIDKIAWWINYDVRIFPSRFVWFWRDQGMTILVKLPSIISDLGVGWLIYKYLSKKKTVKSGFMLSALWLFNPTTWYNSSIWGQTDSIVNLLGLTAVFYLLKKDFVKFTVFFTLSFLFKGSLGIFVPILGLIALYQKHSISVWFKSIAYSLVIIALISIWFHPYLSFPFWIINLYKNRILPGEIGYLTANAFNFWWLIDSGKVLDSTLFFSLPARIWGMFCTLVAMVSIIFWIFGLRILNLFRISKFGFRDFLKGKFKLEDSRIFISLSLTALITFLFMTRIHERYLYPFFPYATLSLAFFPWLFVPYIILAIIHLLNLYHLFWAPSIPFLEFLYENSNFTILLSLMNMLVFFYTLRHLKKAKL